MNKTYFDSLLNALNTIHPLSEELTNDIVNRVQLRKFGKKEIVLREGETNSYLYYVKSGILRAYYEKNAEEVTNWFMSEGDFIVSVFSFFTRNPSYEFIEVLKDSELVMIHFDDLNYLYNKHLEFNIVGRKLTEWYYVKSEERLFAMRKQRALERYEHLLANYPELISQVPGKYLASYLGMTLETLSRIKNKV
ncbi:Crp/Fnr family transcriptional regulator [Chitinophaga sp. Hz27]|uniref:Crp/Fnr family transcriptional regulator n=1 Tax=Chitinophaga sp. Hz27 TaxID=3347169 RepID=UPI0035DA3B92